MAGPTCTWLPITGNLASTSGNWKAVDPIATADIVFDATATDNCTWDISTAALGGNINSFKLNAGYSGAVTIAADITVGSFEINQGTLTVSSNWTVNGTLTLNGGTAFNGSTTYTTTLYGKCYLTGSFTVAKWTGGVMVCQAGAWFDNDPGGEWVMHTLDIRAANVYIVTVLKLTGKLNLADGLTLPVWGYGGALFGTLELSGDAVSASTVNGTLEFGDGSVFYINVTSSCTLFDTSNMTINGLVAFGAPILTIRGESGGTATLTISTNIRITQWGIVTIDNTDAGAFTCNMSGSFRTTTSGYVSFYQLTVQSTAGTTTFTYSGQAFRINNSLNVYTPAILNIASGTAIYYASGASLTVTGTRTGIILTWPRQLARGSRAVKF